MRIPLVTGMLGAVLILAATSLATLIACSGDTRYSQVTAGAHHTCGLRLNGSVVCWGSDENGQLRTPADEHFDAITAGGLYTCGLRSNGTAVCWGYATESGEDLARVVSGPRFRAPFPSEDARFTEIKAGGDVTCGFRTEGGVICWNIRDEFSPFGTADIIEIDPGGTHVCGLHPDGRALCHNFLLRPTPEGERFVSISTAGTHVCGLRSDGSALCWGLNSVGQLSPIEDGTILVDRVSTPEVGPFSDIVTGAYHTCGLRLDSSAVCWGYDFEGLAERVIGSVPDPSDALHKVWLQQQERLSSLLISAPPNDERFTAITVGNLHACGLREDGAISCWGSNEHGQATPPGDSD